jgi:hypothetical protein
MIIPFFKIDRHLGKAQVTYANAMFSSTEGS